jgi:CubicO group peptidase (beta-lactamase class C family)
MTSPHALSVLLPLLIAGVAVADDTRPEADEPSSADAAPPQGWETAEHAMAMDPPPPVDPDACRAEARYPGQAWEDRSAQWAAEQPEAIAALEAYLFPQGLDWDDPERLGVRTDGVVIIHDGAIIYERYAHGYGPDTPHMSWSAAKSFTNAMVGVASREGLLDVTDSICDHIQGLPEASCAVTVQHAMEFATGFSWRETYEGQPPTRSSVLAMLYGQGHPDMGAFVAGHPLRDAPGSTFMYSSGDTNVVSKAAGAALTPRFGEHFPWTVLFEPIGMSTAVWERDGAGTYVGSSYIFATTRDFARFGLLLLEDGCWQGERILPAGWVDWSTQVNEPFETLPIDHEGWSVQGRGFWLNRPVPAIGHEHLPWPHAPEGSFAALGHWRQSIYVVPDAGLVVARNGDDRDGSYKHDETLRLALELIGYEHEADTTPRDFEPLSTQEQHTALVPDYSSSLFRLGSGFAAQEACSCLFVMGMDEDFCREWVRVSPDVARFRVDYDDKRVEARALGMGRISAIYTGERTGCTIED